MLQQQKIEELRESLKIAEQLAQMSLSRSKEIKSDGGRFSESVRRSRVFHDAGQDRSEQQQDETVTAYVPPKQLLLYMVR